MVYILYVCIFASVGVAVSGLLTGRCNEATIGCATVLANDIQNQKPFCGAMSSYYVCVVNELQVAQYSKACDALSILTRKAVEIGFIQHLREQKQCLIETPPQLQLDACETDIGRCGNFAINATNPLMTTTVKCRTIRAFLHCMIQNTPNCRHNTSYVYKLAFNEINDPRYTQDCTGAMTSPVTTHTTTTTTTPPMTRVPTVTPSVAATTTALPTPAVTLKDLDTLKNQLKQAIDEQTFLLLQALDILLKGVRNDLPSRHTLDVQLNDLRVKLTAMHGNLNARLQNVQEAVNKLVTSIGRPLNCTQLRESETSGGNSNWSGQKPSCMERVVQSLGEVFHSGALVVKHLLVVSRLGVQQEGPLKEEEEDRNAVYVILSNLSDAALVLLNNDRVFKKRGIDVKFVNAYFRFSCKA